VSASPTAKRRIAIVTNLAAHYRRPLFVRLAAHYEADFFLTGAGSNRYWSNDHTEATDGFRALPGRNPVVLGWRLVTGRYDCLVISLTGRLSLAAAVLAAKLARRPYVVWIGIWARPGTAFHRMAWPMVRYLLRDADALLVYGSHVARFVEREVGERRRVFQAFQAVDNDRFVRPSASSVDRSRGPLRALFVGRLETGKGLDVLTDSLSLTTSPVALEVAGSGSLEAELRDRVRTSGLERCVAFLGYTPQEALPDVYRRADVLVVPSVTTARFREPWGLVANEAMNAGVPVIATTAVGAAAAGLVVDGETGLVVPEDDAQALAAALDRLAVDRDLLSHLGASARVRVRAWSYAAAEAGFAAAIDAVLTGKGRR
jgi:glycosyltransferase involved in cell wall biosynthesis